MQARSKLVPARGRIVTRAFIFLVATLGATVSAAAPAAEPGQAATEPPAQGDAPASQPEPSTSPKANSDAPAVDAGTNAESQASPSASVANDSAPPASALEAASPGLFEQSQESTAVASSPEGGEHGATTGLSLNGYVRGDLFAGKALGRPEPETKAGYGELALKLKLQKERYGDAFAEVRFKQGLQGDTQSQFLDLREAYVNLYAGPLDLRFGRQIIVWGRADAVNPTNNLTPMDLSVRSPVEDDRRVGNMGARAFLNFAPLRIEGVWMPLYSPSELPTIALPPLVVFGPTSFPDAGLKNGTEAGRIHLELPGFDLSASYLYGYAPLPGLALHDFSVGADTAVRISRTAYNQHVVGMDFSTVLGDFLGVRGEAAYRRPLYYQRRPYAPRPDLNYVFGLDHTFGEVSIIAQYIGGYVFDWQHEAGPTPPLDPSYLTGLSAPLPPFVAQTITDSVNQELAQRNQILFSQEARIRHMASLRAEWVGLHETLTLSALAMVNFTTREWLAFPKLSYRLSDDMSATVGAEIYVGPRDTLFGLIQDELSAGYAELRFSF